MLLSIPSMVRYFTAYWNWNSASSSVYDDSATSWNRLLLCKASAASTFFFSTASYCFFTMASRCPTKVARFPSGFATSDLSSAAGCASPPSIPRPPCPPPPRPPPPRCHLEGCSSSHFLVRILAVCGSCIRMYLPRARATQRSVAFHFEWL